MCYERVFNTDRNGKTAPEIVEGPLPKEETARIFGEIREPENETYLLARSYQQIGQLRVERDFLETSLGRRAGGVKQSAAIIRRFQF